MNAMDVVMIGPFVWLALEVAVDAVLSAYDWALHG